MREPVLRVNAGKVPGLGMRGRRVQTAVAHQPLGLHAGGTRSVEFFPDIGQK
jgi:hypothetical protein